MDLDGWIELVRTCKYLPENDFRKLCNFVIEILVEESNVQPVKFPVTICGDIHGQFYDLLELFRVGGELPNTNYVFMGDFVDRGYYSLETLTLLLLLKARYPGNMTLLRGNHESRHVTQTYGFYDECINKYGNSRPWNICCKLFDYLAVAALIGDRILCVHGGLSPEIKSLDQLYLIDRKIEIPEKGPLCDILWSDPDESDNWHVNPRGAGFLFGPNVTQEFVEFNQLELICRAHQLVQEGYKTMFDNLLITIWSAPNYCYRCGNIASILNFTTPKAYEAKLFTAVPDECRAKPALRLTPYFL